MNVYLIPEAIGIGSVWFDHAGMSHVGEANFTVCGKREAGMEHRALSYFSCHDCGTPLVEQGHATITTLALAEAAERAVLDQFQAQLKEENE